MEKGAAIVDPNDVLDPTVELRNFNDGFVSLTREEMKLNETSFFVDLNDLTKVYKQENTIYRCKWPEGGMITTRFMNQNSSFEFVPDMKPLTFPHQSLPQPQPDDCNADPPNKDETS